MITTGGSAAIGNTIAQMLSANIAVGVGESTPAVGDTGLDFEVYRGPVRVRSYDATTKRVVLAATIPEDIDVSISEIGLFTGESEAGGIVTSFDSMMEQWDVSTWTDLNNRVGGSALEVSMTTANLDSTGSVALSNIQQSDMFQVAYHGAGGAVEVRIKNTDEDYYMFNFTPQTGYNIASTPVSALTKVGSPDLASSNGVSVTHSGSGSVTMDAIKIDSATDGDTLIARQVITPVKKVPGRPLDIEIALVINV